MATVNVPQQAGEIRVAENGAPPTVYRVTDGRVEVADAEEAARLAHVLDGATVSGLSLVEVEEVDTPGPAILAGMSAADLVAYVEAHPEAAAGVLAAEQARPNGPRSTVTAAAERVAAGS